MIVVRSITEAIDKLYERLPTWAKVVFWILIVLLAIDCIVRYGLGSFLLHTIFGP